MAGRDRRGVIDGSAISVGVTGGGAVSGGVIVGGAASRDMTGGRSASGGVTGDTWLGGRGSNAAHGKASEGTQPESANQPSHHV